MTYTLFYKRSNIFKVYGTRLTIIRSAFFSHTSIIGGSQFGHLLGSTGPKVQYYIQYVGNSRSFVKTRTLRMASDKDYMAFLNKANEDPNEGYTKTQGSSSKEFKATDDGAKVPAAIQEATKDSFYVSDADELFVPVYLAWNENGKGLPDEEEFASLIHHPNPSNAEIEISDPADWDTQGQYNSIVDAVRKAGKGNDVRVYRVSKGGVKVEYWIVTTEGKGSSAKLVGAKALAVES